MPQDIQSFKRARAASRDEQAVWMRFIRMFKRNKTLRYIFIVILFLFIIFYTWATLSLEKLNEIGDAFNILNTFFTALAFIGLILTILLQRKDLALQREELKLQRGEMQRQCEEQKRQADEFEEHSRLMKIQRFESFFFQQLKYIDYLSKNIYVNQDNRVRAISLVADQIRNILEYIRNSNSTVVPGILGYLDGLYNRKWRIVQNVYPDLLSWTRKFYSLISYIMSIKIFDIKEKRFYINLIFENLIDDQKYVLLVIGCVFYREQYCNMENLLKEENLFGKKMDYIFKDNNQILTFKEVLKFSMYSDKEVMKYKN